MKRVVETLVLVLAAVGCGEVARDPQRCDGQWCPIASGKHQRLYHASVWTGDELLVWGGLDDDSGDPLATGLRINPKTGAVRPITTEGAPSARWTPFAAWTGHEMLIWGGEVYSEGGDRTHASAVGGSAYDPKTDSWRSIADPRSGKIGSEAVAWTGSELFVWGGSAGSAGRSRDGFLYEPSVDGTRPVGEAIPEAVAVSPDAVAVDGTVVITGGFTNFPEAHPVRYDVAADSWQPVATPPPVLGSDGVAAPVFGYGGRAYFCSRDLLECGAYSIADDTWQTLDLEEAVPPFEDWPAWTVAPHELVFFGSPDFRGSLRIATSYNFDSQTWQPLPTAGAPEPRRGQSASWIDTGVLFWGGANAWGPPVVEQGWLLKRE